MPSRCSIKAFAICICLFALSGFSQASVIETDRRKLEARWAQDDATQGPVSDHVPETFFIVTIRDPLQVQMDGLPAVVHHLSLPPMEFEAYQLGERGSRTNIIGHQGLVSAVSCFLQRWVGVRPRTSQFFVYEVQRQDAIRTPCPTMGKAKQLMRDGYYVTQPWLTGGDRRLIRWAQLPASTRQSAWSVVQGMLTVLPWREVNPVVIPQRQVPMANPGPYRPQCLHGPHGTTVGTLTQEDVDEVLGGLPEDDETWEPSVGLTDEDVNNFFGTQHLSQGSSDDSQKEDEKVEEEEDEDPDCDAAQAQAAQQQLIRMSNAADTDLNLLFDDAESVLRRLLREDQMDSNACSSTMSQFRSHMRRSMLPNGRPETGNCCQLLALIKEQLTSHACSEFSQLRFRLKLASNTLAGGTYDDIMLRIGNENMVLAEHPSKYFNEERVVNLQAAFGSSKVPVRDVKSFAVYSVPDQRGIADEWIVDSITLTGRCAGSQREALIRIRVNEGFSRWGDYGDRSQYKGRIDIDDWRWVSPDAQTQSVAVQPPGQPNACTHLKALEVRLRIGSGLWGGTYDKIYMDIGPGLLPGNGRLLLTSGPSPGYNEPTKVDLKQTFGSEMVPVGDILPKWQLFRLYSALAKDEWRDSKPDEWILAGLTLRGTCAQSSRTVVADKYATIDEKCKRSIGEDWSEVYRAHGLSLQDWHWERKQGGKKRDMGHDVGES